jgi:DNA-directed RNA polymerase specialized sigma24 family protein
MMKRRAGSPHARNIWVAARGRHYLLLADADLISLAEKGAPEAFATLYDRHRRSAFSLAYRMMGDREAFAETWRDSRRDQIRKALKALPPEQSKIPELSYLCGHTHVEISGLLNIPLGTVKGRLRLGLEKMRGSLLWETA